MNTLRRSLIFVVALVLILASAFLITRNLHTTHLDIIFTTLEWPLVVILLIAFTVGVLLSCLLNAWVLFMQKRKIKQLNKQLDDYKQEVSQLRQSPMNGIQ